MSVVRASAGDITTPNERDDRPARGGARLTGHRRGRHPVPAVMMAFPEG